MTKGPITITTASGAQLAVGDRIRIADTRRWYVRVWHWIIRRPKPVLDYRVVEAKSETSFTVRQQHNGGKR